MSSLISRLDIENRIGKENIKRYAIQCSLAAIVVLILLLVLDAVTQTVLIAAYGSSAFIAFAVPRSLHSSPRCLVGGYLVGIFAGTSMSVMLTALDFVDIVFAHSLMILFGALATGIAMFLMVITKTEHPPAAALALGLVLNEWDGVTLLVLVVGVTALSLFKRLVLPLLMDLV